MTALLTLKKNLFFTLIIFLKVPPMGVWFRRRLHPIHLVFLDRCDVVA